MLKTGSSWAQRGLSRIWSREESLPQFQMPCPQGTPHCGREGAQAPASLQGCQVNPDWTILGQELPPESEDIQFN